MGSVHPNDEALHPGCVLGPYELLALVGSGGMAHVWAARHRGSGGVVALKMLRSHLSDNTSFREMFFDEARIASRIRHENVCATYELVDLDGILTLVMEWVDGSSLVHMLRPGEEALEDCPRVPLPIRHGAKIISETCAGLHAAHDLVDDDGRTLAVVHRDVSPHNVLVTLDGRVKLTDFGVAKALGKFHMTIAGQVKGKLAYMAPEQLVGGGVDRRTDVFALGTVLYEITTGHRPFQGDHDPQLMTAIIMGNFVPPHEIVPGYPRELENILLRAMATEVDARYSTALQFRQALERWLASSGPALGPTQIAGLLHERCGSELQARAAAMSTLYPIGQPPGPPALAQREHRIESGSSAMEVARRSNTQMRHQGIGMIASSIAVLLGAVVGLGVLFYVRESRRAHLAGRTIPTFVDASFTAVSAITADADAAAAAEVNEPSKRIEVAADDVTLVIPDGARLFVGGKQLAVGTMSVPRPDAGAQTVVVRADGREDAVVLVEPNSPSVIEVAMVPRKRTQHPTPLSTVTMPPNPYE